MSEPLLSLEAVSKSYLRGRHEVRVLHDATLRLYEGEVLSVLGRRGAGKTTLLKLAAGLEAPDRGSIRLAGEDLTALSDAALSRLLGEQVGWVQSEGPRSRVHALDYVALPLLMSVSDREAYGRAEAALARVGVAECARQGWETLSDSERGLVGIAHAIARAPKLLLVDDVSTILGIRDTDALARLLRTLAKESRMSVLMTVSESSAALRSNRTMSLAGGRLSGPPDPGERRDGDVIDLSSRERLG
ncbi:MAG TPA: ATP-binding cassette domain-containing protein [Solirubrobacteraceae bacterium]|jgi:predicted ABC-type transport system involved in lysophospholipase L1 biosynthesis ATPase subunit